MSFGLYLTGYLIFCAGVLLGLHYLGVSSKWIAVAGLILGGLGIVTAVTRTRTKDQ